MSHQNIKKFTPCFHQTNEGLGGSDDDSLLLHRFSGFKLERNRLLDLDGNLVRSRGKGDDREGQADAVRLDHVHQRIPDDVVTVVLVEPQLNLS